MYIAGKTNLFLRALETGFTIISHKNIHAHVINAQT